MYHQPMQTLGKLADRGKIRLVTHGTEWCGISIVMLCPCCGFQHIFLAHRDPPRMVSNLGYVSQFHRGTDPRWITLLSGIQAPCGLQFTIQGGEIVGFGFEVDDDD